MAVARRQVSTFDVKFLISTKQKMRLLCGLVSYKEPLDNVCDWFGVFKSSLGVVEAPDEEEMSEKNNHLCWNFLKQEKCLKNLTKIECEVRTPSQIILLHTYIFNWKILGARPQNQGAAVSKKLRKKNLVSFPSATRIQLSLSHQNCWLIIKFGEGETGGVQKRWESFDDLSSFFSLWNLGSE